MTKGKRILRAVFGVIMSALFFLSIVAFFVMPTIRDREAREMLGDPDAFVTDTARDSWIFVDEGGVAAVYADRCFGKEELTIPSAVNGVAVTGFDFRYKAKPVWVKKITFPPTLRSIETYLFASWDGIEEIVFEDGIEDLSNLSIGQRERLDRLVLPRSVKKINKGIFSYKDHCVKVCYAGTEEEWLAIGDSAAYIAERYTMVYEYDAQK